MKDATGFEQLTRNLEVAARQESDARKRLDYAEQLRSNGRISQDEYRTIFHAWSAARLAHERAMHALSAHLQAAPPRHKQRDGCVRAAAS